MIGIDLFTIVHKIKGATYGVKLLEISNYEDSGILLSQRALFGVQISGEYNRLIFDILYLKVVIC